MKLEDVTAEIRPRVPWESIDLGCALARRHWLAVMKAWSMTVLPLWLLMAALLHNHPVLMFLAVWWLKPIYDRVPLLVVSRALFGAVPPMREVLRGWPKLMTRRLGFTLFLGRFSPARSLSLPVAELEGLRRGAYRQRVELLERNGGEGATMATLAGIILEGVASISIVLLVFMMVPSHVSTHWWNGLADFFNYFDGTDIPSGFFWMMVVVQMLAITLMEPFYVSAGFALYINSRTLTEGWDIELAFKRMSTRLAGAAKNTIPIFVALLAIVSFLPNQATAESTTPPSHSQLTVEPLTEKKDVQAFERSIDEITQDPDFEVHYRIEQVPKKSSDGEPSSFFRWLSEFLGHLGGSGAISMMGVLSIVLFWTAVLAVVAGIIYLIYKNRHVFGVITVSATGRKGRLMTHELMGMDIRPESLPDDVANAARSAWQDGNCHLALSLLYRGSIAWLIHRAALPIEEGDTEGDCLLHVKSLSDARKGEYFAELTEVWIATAYGKKVPDDQSILTLCESWPFQESGKKLERKPS